MKKTLLFTAICILGIAAVNAQVTQINANQDLEHVTAVGGNKAIFVSQVDDHLWVSDGTQAGTTLLSSTIAYDQMGMLLNNKLIFKGSTATTGQELYITDGTTAGTILLKDIITGPTTSQIGDDMALLNGFVYFTAVTPAYGRELWRTDGTAGGTNLFKDIVTGPTGSNAANDFNLFSNGSYLLFNAETGSNGKEVWKSDGTAAGTNVLKDINTGPLSSDASTFYKFGNIVLFQAIQAGFGNELWKTDGTTNGTVMVKDINNGPANSNSVFFPYFFENNGKAYFSADNGVNGEELWVTDGTMANTILLKDMETGPEGSFNFLVDAIRVGNKIVYPVTNLMGTRFQLWVSDGTPGGTTVLKDFTYDDGDIPFILPNYQVTPTGDFTQPLFNGTRFFFVGKTQAEGTELWISDGTVAGTQMVKNIGPADADGIEDISYYYTSDALYFAANDGAFGNELWKSNGTGTGTVRVADISVGAGSSDPQIWPVFNNKLTLTANDGNNAMADLYALNGNVSPLPIKLIDFSVKAVAGNALLQWATSQEINSDKFIVQRSFDGVQFENIGSVAAAGQSGSKRSYSYTDAGIINSGKATVYYRLQAMDTDGKTELTKTVSLKLAAASWNVQLLNNPVQSAARISLNGLTGAATMKISDVSGKTLVTTIVANNGNLSVATANLPKGMYFMSIENAGSRKTIPFVKQ